MLVPDGARDVLLGRLTRERREPLAVVRGFPGRWRGFAGNSALAVTDGLLWLATPQLIGGPSVASVATSSVSEAELDSGRSASLRLRLRVDEHSLTFTLVDDEDTCRSFVTALRAESAWS